MRPFTIFCKKKKTPEERLGFEVLYLQDMSLTDNHLLQLIHYFSKKKLIPQRK